METPKPKAKRNARHRCGDTGRKARQCATDGCINHQGKGHTLLRHEKLADGSRGRCREPGCTCAGFTARPCKQPVAVAGDACPHHGGQTPRGVDHPNFKTGRYSKYANGMRLNKVIDEYEAAMGNPDILSVKEELAVIDVYLQQTLNGLIAVPTVTLDKIRLALTTFLIAKEGAPKDRALNKLRALLDVGGEQAARRDEFFRVADIRRRFASTELRRETASLGMVPYTMVLSVITALADLVKNHVTNPAERIAVFDGLEGISGGRVASPVGAVTDLDATEEPGRGLSFVKHDG